MRCLWLSGVVPSSCPTGLLRYSRGLSDALARAGADVVGLGLRGGDSATSTSARWIIVSGHRKAGIAALASPLPRMTAACESHAYRLAIRERLEAGVDTVIIDHLQMGWALSELRRQLGWQGQIIYVAHNHEASVRAEVARAFSLASPKGLALRADSAKAARLEKTLLEQADVVIALTDHDAERLRADGAAGEVLVLAPGSSAPTGSERCIDRSVPKRAVVVGSLDWHVKQLNLETLVAAVDPVFAGAGAELHVIGKAPSKLRERLEPGLRATQFVGWLDDLGPPLADARAGIVCEPFGGGFKLKALEYVFAGVPIVALAGSIAGLPLQPGRDLLEFGSVDDLAHGALDVLDRPEDLNRLQRNAFEACRGLFDWDDRGRAMLDVVLRHSEESH